MKCIKTEVTYTVEGVIGYDDINDLAVLKTTEAATPFPIGNSRKIRKGHILSLLTYREEYAEIDFNKAYELDSEIRK